jgi:hypothetical protein
MHPTETSISLILFKIPFMEMIIFDFYGLLDAKKLASTHFGTQFLVHPTAPYLEF